jgi:hypothetical protein
MVGPTNHEQSLQTETIASIEGPLNSSRGTACPHLIGESCCSTPTCTPLKCQITNTKLPSFVFIYLSIKKCCLRASNRKKNVLSTKSHKEHILIKEKPMLRKKNS